MYGIKRGELSRKCAFPLIRWIYYTGEDVNPYRCECCLTKKQRAETDCAISEPASQDICCRKCGVSI